jgi:hypothetical protein
MSKVLKSNAKVATDAQILKYTIRKYKFEKSKAVICQSILKSSHYIILSDLKHNIIDYHIIYYFFSIILNQKKPHYIK